MNKNLLKPYKEKARILGLNPSYLMQIANGHRKPSAELALKIHEKFEMPLSDIRPDIYPEHIFNKGLSNE